MKMNMEEFNELTRLDILKILKSKKIMITTEKQLVSAEKRVINAVRRFVENDETIKLNGFLNNKFNLTEQIEANLSMAMRYLRENDADAIVLTYIKTAANCNSQLEKLKKDEFYLGLHDKYIERADEFLTTKNNPQQI